jgi:hypothetical protein
MVGTNFLPSILRGAIVGVGVLVSAGIGVIDSVGISINVSVGISVIVSVGTIGFVLVGSGAAVSVEIGSIVLVTLGGEDGLTTPQAATIDDMVARMSVLNKVFIYSPSTFMFIFL